MNRSPGPSHCAAAAIGGGPAVHTGDEVGPHPRPVAFGIVVELGEFTVVEFAYRSEQRQPRLRRSPESGMGLIAARRYSSCMHGSTSADASGGVAHLVDRHPTVSPERLIAQLRPPPTFAEVSFATYRPDPAEPTQLPPSWRGRFCRQAVERRAGRRNCWQRGAARCRAVPGRRSAWARLICWRRPISCPAGPDGAGCPNPKAFATFGELTQLAGVFGFVECIDLLANYTAVCTDEFELDDPGNTTLISRMLSSLVERGVSVAATSNTLPEQLGEGRFAAQDFLREINTLASIFTTVRIEGPDYRHRGLPPAPRPLSDEEVVARAAASTGRRWTISMRCARTWPPCTRRGT